MAEDNDKKEDKIGKALGLPPIVPENRAVITIDKMESNVALDFHFARENLKSAIETGTAALEELSVIAKQSQAARTYEVLAGLITTLSNANKDMLELNKKFKDLNGIKEEAGPQKVTNNLFVGTTAELQALIKGTPKNTIDLDEDE